MQHKAQDQSKMGPVERKMEITAAREQSTSIDCLIKIIKLIKPNKCHKQVLNVVCENPNLDYLFSVGLCLQGRCLLFPFLVLLVSPKLSHWTKYYLLNVQSQSAPLKYLRMHTM